MTGARLCRRPFPARGMPALSTPEAGLMGHGKEQIGFFSTELPTTERGAEGVHTVKFSSPCCPSGPWMMT
jgi:hypothetical protein